MRKAAAPVSEVLKRLATFYGPQEPCWPVDPYLFLVWWHCGYPASDAACARGWDALTKAGGIEPEDLLRAGVPQLAAPLKAGGMVPELRAVRLKEIAARVQDELGGDLRGALRGPLAQSRKLLRKFPNIGDPGVDRILLFAGIAPLAAVPSNCPHVLVRVLRGPERENYGATYRDAQEAIAAGVPENLEARCSAYLLLKIHGQTLCKRTNPKCAKCPVAPLCSYQRVTSHD